MRVLHVGDDYVGGGVAPAKSGAERKRDHRFHGWQRVPLWNLSAHRRCDPEGSQGRDTVICREGSGAMSHRNQAQILLEPERYELRAAAPYRFDLDRREFFRFLGAGVLVVSILKSAGVAQESGWGEPAARGFPSQGNRCLASSWRKRQNHGLHRKGRDGPEHSDFSEPGRG